MPSSFVTYIDESGDEGFVFNPDGSGSSRWFVISAVVFRKANDLQSVACLKEVRGLLGKPNGEEERDIYFCPKCQPVPS